MEATHTTCSPAQITDTGTPYIEMQEHLDEKQLDESNPKWNTHFGG